MIKLKNNTKLSKNSSFIFLKRIIFFIIFTINTAQAIQFSDDTIPLIHEFLKLTEITPIPLLDLPDGIQKQYDQLISVDAFGGDYVAYLSHQASIAAQYYSDGDVNLPAYFVVINACIQNINRFIPSFQSRFKALKEQEVVPKNSRFLFDPDSPDFESKFITSIKNNDYPLRTSVFLRFVIIKRLESFVNKLRNTGDYKSLSYKETLDFFFKSLLTEDQALLEAYPSNPNAEFTQKRSQQWIDLILNNLNLSVSFYNHWIDFNTNKQRYLSELDIPFYVIFAKPFEKLHFHEFILAPGVHFLDISLVTERISYHVYHDIDHLTAYIKHIINGTPTRLYNQRKLRGLFTPASHKYTAIEACLENEAKDQGNTWNQIKRFFENTPEIDFTDLLNHFFYTQHETTNVPTFSSGKELYPNNFSPRETIDIINFLKKYLTYLTVNENSEFLFGEFIETFSKQLKN